MKIKSLILICFTIILSTLIFAFDYKDNAYSYSVSKSETVMEMNSGRVLYAVNENEKLPMASTTKVLTALTVIENFDLNKVVTVPRETVGVEGSSVYLRAGDKFTVSDLLYGLMLRSGNDCAETLAVTLTGSIKEFAVLMNETARKYGAENSSFVNPHGLNDENHYTTALDLCKIACASMKNEKFKEIVSSATHTATELNEGKKILWLNKNKLLKSYKGANGVKTGYTVRAGKCLVSSAEREGMQVVAVVLNSPDMFDRSKELLDYAFDEYDLVKVVDKSKFDYEVISGVGKPFKLRIDENFVYPVKKGEKINAEVNLPENLALDVKSGVVIGDMKIYCEKRLIFSQKIYTL